MVMANYLPLLAVLVPTLGALAIALTGERRANLREFWSVAAGVLLHVAELGGHDDVGVAVQHLHLVPGGHEVALHQRGQRSGGHPDTHAGGQPPLDGAGQLAGAEVQPADVGASPAASIQRCALGRR